MDYKALGENIRKFRRAHGLTQAKLSEKLGFSEGYIGQIENAMSKPSLETVVKIANGLGVTVDQLLAPYYEEPEKVYMKEIYERVSAYPLEKRVRALEGLTSFLDSLEKFDNAK